jgi:hypothetical protein
MATNESLSLVWIYACTKGLLNNDAE